MTIPTPIASALESLPVAPASAVLVPVPARDRKHAVPARIMASVLVLVALAGASGLTHAGHAAGASAVAPSPVSPATETCLDEPVPVVEVCR